MAKTMEKLGARPEKRHFFGSRIGHRLWYHGLSTDCYGTHYVAIHHQKDFIRQWYDYQFRTADQRAHF